VRNKQLTLEVNVSSGYVSLPRYFIDLQMTGVNNYRADNSASTSDISWHNDVQYLAQHD